MQRGLRVTQSLFRLCAVRPPVRHVVCRRQHPRFLLTNTWKPAMAYSVEERGDRNTLDYRVFFKSPSGEYISPFHDIPVYADADQKTLNMVVEVPRWTNAKMEIATKEKLNPIKQDVKKGKLRFVHNCFPHHGYIWNYGALPQTWEDPGHTDDHTSCKGDNDPIDVCEIGHKVHKRGAVIQVKPLGVMALIDEGETDWKILAIDVMDPLAPELNDIEDIEKQMPGFLAATKEWFRIYKMPAGKPPNEFAFEGKAKNREFALNVVSHTNGQWKQLMKKETDACGMVCENTQVDDSLFKITPQDAKAIVDETKPMQADAPIDPDVDKWHYVKL